MKRTYSISKSIGNNNLFFVNAITFEPSRFSRQYYVSSYSVNRITEIANKHGKTVTTAGDNGFLVRYVFSC